MKPSIPKFVHMQDIAAGVFIVGILQCMSPVFSLYIWIYRLCSSRAISVCLIDITKFNCKTPESLKQRCSF